MKLILNEEQPKTNILFLKELSSLERCGLHRYLVAQKNKEAILLHLDKGFAVSVEGKDWRITRFSRREYFYLVTSVEGTKGFLKGERGDC